MENNWKFKSLETLEKKSWPALSPDEGSHLVRTCHELRKKVLDEFSTEDLRIMIGQDIGLKYLIPLALEQLQKNILAEGDFYPGDLLKAVLTSDSSFWKSEAALFDEVLALLEANQALFSGWEMAKEWSGVINDFKAIK